MPPENSQQYYAIAKLEETARAVKQAVNELPLLRKRLEKFKDNKSKAREIYNDLKQQREKLLSALNTAVLSLLETEQSELVKYSVKLSNSVKAFNLMTPDYSKICAVLSDYITELPTTANAATIGHLMSAVKMGYYPTDIEHVKYLEQGIEFPEDISVNLFDPCCGCGLALRTLAGENNCTTYGAELDKHRAEEALTRLNRVAFGTYFQSRISNEAFHLMLKYALKEIQSAAKQIWEEIKLELEKLMREQLASYGYNFANMTPITSKETALKAFDSGEAVYLLYPDNTEGMAESRQCH